MSPNRALYLSAAVLAVLVLIAVLADFIGLRDPYEQNLLHRFVPPGGVRGGEFFLAGTDELGRDLFSRIIHGARISVAIAIASVVISLVVGTLVGLVAGYYRGMVEVLIMRLTDIMLSIPALILAVITVAVLGPGLQNLVIVLALTRWPRYARVAYAQALAVTPQEFVTAGRMAGTGDFSIMLRHYLPNVLDALVVVATLEFGLMIIFEASLSFVGLGVQVPTPSLGTILSTGKDYVANAWWIGVLPGIYLFALVLAVNILGDRLRDRFDPALAGNA